MRHFQEWRGALWLQAHGSLSSAAAPAAQALQEELFAFAWLRLTKALRAIAAAAPGVAALRETERLAGVVDRVNSGLGLQGGPPPKPLLWRLGGHPSNPPSVQLWEASQQLQLFCDATRAPASGSFADSPAAEQLISRLLARKADAATPENMQIDADGEPQVSREGVAAVAGALSADWGLRRALLEGMGLFAMAASLARGQQSSLAASRLGGMEATAAVDAALSIVNALQERFDKAIEQVRFCNR